MYHRFIEQISEFIFAEDEPEKADIIFIPGNGYSQMAEKAAAAVCEKICAICPSKWKIQHHCRQVWRSVVGPGTI